MVSVFGSVHNESAFVHRPEKTVTDPPFSADGHFKARFIARFIARRIKASIKRCMLKNFAPLVLF